MAIHHTPILSFHKGEILPRRDSLAIEEPLEIVLVSGPRSARRTEVFGITMRTPGHDAELAAGLLFAEGIITDRDQVEGIVACESSNPKGYRLRVELSPSWVPPPHAYSTRNISSACGVCGRQTIDDLLQRIRLIPKNHLELSGELITTLPDRLRAAQKDFARTGGLHACGLFTAQGQFLDSHEDVGRHNAVDKIVGSQFLQDQLPLQEGLFVVSGRASFELVQKSVVAGANALIAVGAPSSLAVELAQSVDLILIGFAREGRFNIYSGFDRITIRS
ncbi:MAG: formate dehydrogenase accessory sulfurtransferase FdhD [Gemmataceae bacterium]|nr:formate dehydrogenase accessory sulfurtransferase FdhD [Gemmataceae bacterium]